MSDIKRDRKPNLASFLRSKADFVADQLDLIEKAGDKTPLTRRWPIDDVIEKLRQRTHPPSLADKWRKLPDRKVLLVARQSVFSALDRAAREDPKIEQNQRNSDLALVKDAQRVDRVVTEFLRHGKQFGDELELLGKIVDVFLGEVREVADLARRTVDELAPPAGYPGDAWRYGFVTAIARRWRELTGVEPSPKPDGLFIKFVDAAWMSGGDDMPPESWEWTIRKVLRGDETPHSNRRVSSYEETPRSKT
jgi:hypothetical protein